MLKCNCVCHRKDECYPAIAMILHPMKGLIPICYLCFEEYSGMEMIARILSANQSFYHCQATRDMKDSYLEWLTNRIMQDEMVES